MRAMQPTDPRRVGPQYTYYRGRIGNLPLLDRIHHLARLISQGMNGLGTHYQNMISCLSASIFQDMLVVLQLQCQVQARYNIIYLFISLLRKPCDMAEGNAFQLDPMLSSYSLCVHFCVSLNYRQFHNRIRDTNIKETE